MSGTVMSGRVGVQYGADGSNLDSRQGQHGESITQQAHGKYSEAAKRGGMFGAVNATARSPGTSLSTTAGLVLYNPANSGKRLLLKKVSLSPAATGTEGAGVIHHCGFTLNGPTATQSGVIPTGTAVTPKNLDLGGSANNSVATVLENATLNAAPAALYPFCLQNDAVQQTTASPNNTVYEDVDGAIVLEPGAGYCLMGVSTGSSSPVAWFGYVWEEESIAA